MVRYHQQIELIHVSNTIAKATQQFFSEAKQARILNQDEALSIAKILTCFRITERAASEIFGFMDEKFFHEDYILPMYKKLVEIIDQIYG